MAEDNNIDYFNRSVEAAKARVDANSGQVKQNLLDYSFTAPSTDYIDAFNGIATTGEDKPDTSTVTGELSNLGRFAKAGAQRDIAGASNIPAVGQAYTDIMATPEEVRKAYFLLQDPNASEKATPEEINKANELVNQSTIGFLGDTYKEVLDRSTNKLRTASEEYGDPSRYDNISLENRDALTKFLDQSYKPNQKAIEEGAKRIGEGDIGGLSQYITGTTKAIFDVKDKLFEEDGLKRVLGIAEYAAENAASLGVGIFGKAGATLLNLSNIGYGAGTLAEGITESIESGEQKGDTSDLAKQGLYSAGAAALEQLGDKLNIDTAKGLGKVVSPTKVTKVASETAAKVTSKIPSKLKTAGSVTSDLASTAVREGTTEYFQTLAEDKAKLQDADLGEAFKAGIIGAGAGVGSTVAVSAIKPSLGLTGKATKEAAKLAGKAGLATGKGIGKGLYSLTNKAFAKARKERKDDQANVDEAIKTGDISNVKTTTGKIDALDKITVDTDPTKAITNVKQANNIISSEKFQMEALAEVLPTLTDKADIKATQEKIAQHVENINQAETALTNLQSKAILPTEELDTAIDDSIKGNDEATVRSFGSFASKPTSLTSEQATKLAQSPKLTDNQKAQLTTYAKIAEGITDIGTVSDEIINGAVKGKKFNRRMLGINDYQQSIYQAVEDGNQQQADKYLGLMDSFNEGHKAKLELMDKAIAEHNSGGITPETKSTLKLNGLHANPNKQGQITPFINIRDTVARESKLINDSYQALSELANKPKTTEKVQSPSEEVKTSEKATEEVSQDKVEPTKQEPIVDESLLVQEPKVETKQEIKDEVQPEEQVEPKQESQEEVKVEPVSKQAPIEQPIDNEVQETVVDDQLDLESVNGLEDALINSLPTHSKFIRTAHFDKKRNIYLEAYRTSLPYEGLTKLMIYKNSDGKWQIENTNNQRIFKTVDTITKSIVIGSDIQPEVKTFDTLDGVKSFLNEPKNIIPLTKSIGGSKSAVGNTAQLLRNEFAIRKLLYRLLNKLKEHEQGKFPIQVYNNFKDRFSNKIESLHDSIVKARQALPTTNLSPSRGKQIYTYLRQQQARKLKSSLGTASDLLTGAVEAKPTNETNFAKEFLDGISEDTINDVTPLNKQNLLKKWFKAGTNTKSLLNNSNDGIQHLKDNREQVIQDVYGDENVPDGIDQALDAFIAFYDKVGDALDSIYKAKYETTKYQDLTQFFAENGKLHPNVKAAILVGAFSWLQDNGRETQFSTREDLEKMLGLKEEDYIPKDVWNLLGNKGSKLSFIKSSMGKAALQALNFKPNTDALETSGNNLEQALGSWAAGALIKSGYLQESTVIKNEDLIDIYGTDSRGMPEAIKNLKLKGVIQLNQIAMTPDGKPITELENIFESLKGFSSLTSDLFGTEFNNPLPSFKPQKAVTKVTRSIQEVSKQQQEILEKDQARRNYIHKKPIGTYLNFSDENQLLIAGYDNTNPDSLLDVNKAKLAGKNRGIEREWNILREWYGVLASKDRLGKPFHFLHTVWQQGRMGIKNRFNHQASKLHRYSMYREEWIQSFKVGSNSGAEQFFKLAVAEGFDIKGLATESDKQYDSTSLENYEKVIQLPVIRSGIDAMKQILQSEGNRTDELEKAVVEAVIASKGNMKSYLSIVNQAQFELAQNESDFTHSLAREVDGITNGVAISVLQFARNNTDEMFRLLQRMGIYNKDISYADWITTQGNLDSYKTLAKDFTIALEEKVKEDPKLQKLYQINNEIFGELATRDETDPSKFEVTSDGRKIAKPFLMTSIYGAGIMTLASNHGSDAIDKLYDRLQEKLDIFSKSDRTNEDKQILIKETQKVLDIFNSVLDLKGNKSKKIANFNQLLKFELTKKETTTFREALGSLVQKPLEQAMNKDYGIMFESSKKFTAATNVMYYMFEQIYNKRKAEIIDSKAAEFEQRTGEKYPEWMKALSNQESKDLLEELRNLLPIINTATSKISASTIEDPTERLTTELNTGLMVAGYEQKAWIPDNAAKNFPSAVVIDFNGSVNGKKSSSTYSQVRQFESPSAKAIPLLITSIDAQTQLQIMELFSIFNVHDASYFSGHDFETKKQKYNEILFNIQKQYGVPIEIAKSFKRIYESATALGLDISKLPIVESQTVEYGIQGDYLKTTLTPFGKALKGLLQLDMTNTEFSNYMENNNTTEIIDSGLNSLIKDANTHRAALRKTYSQVQAVGQYYKGEGSMFSPNPTQPITEPKLVEQVAETPTEPQIDNSDLIKSTAFKNFISVLEGEGDTLAIEITKGLEQYYKNNIDKQSLSYPELVQAFFETNGIYNSKQLKKLIPKSQKQSVMDDYIENFEKMNYDSPDMFYGSSAQQDLLNNYTFTQVEKINKLNSEEVFDELGKNEVVQDSPEHTTYLRGLLTNVVNQVLVPFRLHTTFSTETETVGATNGQDMYIVNQMYNTDKNGNPIRPSGMLANGIRMSSREVYVHELLHNITQNALETNLVLRAQVNRLWHQAKDVLSVKDFLSDPTIQKTDANYKTEMEAAQARYDHIFKPREGKKEQDYLHEFVAMAANEQFMKALAGIPLTSISPVNYDLAPNRGLLNKLQNLITRILNYVGSRLSGTLNKSADKQLQALILNLANVDSGSKAILRRRFNRLTTPFLVAATGINKVVKPITQTEAKVKRAVKDIADTPNVKEASNKFMKEINTLGNGLRDSDNSVVRATAGLFGSLVTEAKGRFNQIAKFQDIKRISNKIIDQDRESIVVTTKNTLASKFSTELSKDEKKSLFYYMKTAPTNLLNNLGTEETIKLLTDKPYLKAQMKQVIGQLSTRADGTWMIQQALGLGKFMTTGRIGQPNQLFNSDSIVNKLTKGGDIDIGAIGLVEQLASMNALVSMNQSQYEMLGNVVTRESTTDNTSNGFTFLNSLLDQHLKESIKEFKDNPFNRIEGYVVDINNPDIEVRTGTLADEAEMANQGFARSTQPLKRDAAEKNTSNQSEHVYLYVNKHGGLNDYLAGAVNLQSKKSKGTNVFDLHVNAGSQKPITSSKAQLTKLISMNAKAARTTSYRSNTDEVFMAPSFDSKGNVIEYRYLMNDFTKDTVLERDTNYDAVLGRMLANTTIKPRIEQQNNKLVHAMRQQFNEDYANNTENYVTISGTSSNPRYREIWQQLPRSMKQEIRKVWKNDAIIIPSEAVDMLFGYRKYSLSSSLQELKELAPNERTALQNAAINVLGSIGLLSRKNIERLKKGGNLIQDLVKIAKEIIVIKTGVVTIGNTLSNMIYLLNRGVSVWDIVKNYSIAGKALIRYKRQDKRLREVNQLILDSNLTPKERSKLQEEQLILSEEIRTNPIKGLVREGVLQHIVEDVTRETDTATRAKGFLEDKLDKVTTKLGRGIPPIIKTIGSEALVLKGSTIYTIMNEAAQFSDFGARYVLFEHLTKKKGQHKAKALGDVVDSFIDYDLPTHKGIQYLNDMGILQFTKYLIRIQKQILRLFKDHPARTLMIMATQGILGNLPDVTDTFLDSPATRITDPLSMAVDAHDEMFTAQIAGSVF